MDGVALVDIKVVVVRLVRGIRVDRQRKERPRTRGNSAMKRLFVDKVQRKRKE